MDTKSKVAFILIRNVDKQGKNGKYHVMLNPQGYFMLKFGQNIGKPFSAKSRLLSRKDNFRFPLI